MIWILHKHFIPVYFPCSSAPFKHNWWAVISCKDIYCPLLWQRHVHYFTDILTAESCWGRPNNYIAKLTSYIFKTRNCTLTTFILFFISSFPLFVPSVIPSYFSCLLFPFYYPLVLFLWVVRCCKDNFFFPVIQFSLIASMVNPPPL